MDKRTTATTLGFRSSDGASAIKATLWEGAAASRPRAIVQIVHGMSEHIGRYDDFARHLAQRGYVVCGEDHIGHGRSAQGDERLGCLPPDGKEMLIADVHELRRTVAARYAGQTPYVIFGHSMGSFIVRAYLARHGQGVAAAVVCGTGQQPIALSRAGNLLARALCALKGPDHRSALIDGMGAGAYGKRIPDARTPFDWICTDPAVVDAYIADPWCGAMFSVGGYAALTDLTGEVAAAGCARSAPRGLPLLFVAGDGDPVGDFGAGVRKAAAQYTAAGLADVQVKLYAGMRHEILNEPGHEQVYADVERWMEERL